MADTVAARLTELYPSARLMRRDLAAERLPHLDEITLKAITTRDPAEAERLKAAARQSDQLTDELLEADLLGDSNADVELWHSLCAQSLDRPGRAAGQDLPVLRWRCPGLAKDKKAILVLASGGVLRKARGARGILSNLTCVKS